MARRQRRAKLLIGILILQIALLCLACTAAGTHLDCCETRCALCGFIATLRRGEMLLPLLAVAAFSAGIALRAAGSSRVRSPEFDTLISRKVQLND